MLCLSDVTTVVAPTGQVQPRQVGRQRVALRHRLSHFLMVAGPGLIVMIADNDAGAVSTYTETGARFGTTLLWVLVLLLPVTYFVQEMVADWASRPAKALPPSFTSGSASGGAGSA
jgi:hypothetical protein